MKKVYITTLGCKVNQFESAALKTGFTQRQVIVTESVEDADIIVVNTCTVTNKAGAQSRQIIRHSARANPHAQIVVTGCHAQLAAKELKSIDIPNPERLCIIGSDQKERLVGHLLDTSSTSITDIITEDLRETTNISRMTVDRFGNRTRAYLRVQDGCNSFCSYCIVPYTRGQSRSMELKEVVSQAVAYAQAGHKEIVITGIHVGQYGKDFPASADIALLLKTLCSETPDVRYRLSSIEPLEISLELLTFISEIDNLMPHLHIPLQSGDNDILNRMNRRYSREQFASVVSRCRAMLPDAAIGIDVLVGFPGESEAHFNNTRELLEDIDCTYLHVFPYSKRPGTAAAAMKNQIDKHEKHERVTILRTLGEAKRHAFYQRNCTNSRKVLIENARDKAGNLTGFTDNYIPVSLPGDDHLKNSIINARLLSVVDNTVRADVIFDS